MTGKTLTSPAFINMFLSDYNHDTLKSVRQRAKDDVETETHFSKLETPKHPLEKITIQLELHGIS